MSAVRTEDLIQEMVRDARPVRRLASPVWRLALWLGPSLLSSAAIVQAMGLRPDIQEKLAEPTYVIEVVAALLTGVLAGLAALCATYPGRPVWERFAPLPPLAVWLGSLGDGCWRTLMRMGPDGLHFMPDLICFPTIVIVGALPAFLIFRMVRRGAPTAPVSTMALAALAAAALGAAALRLFHPQDASVMVLVWQFGSVALLTLLGAAAGQRILRWPISQLRSN